MTEELNDGEMRYLAESSRKLLPSAFAALTEMTAELTGKSPSVQRYWTVSRFFLMHFCDQFVFQESRRLAENAPCVSLTFRIPRWTSAGPTVAKERLSAIRHSLSGSASPVSVRLLTENGQRRVSARSKLVSLTGARAAPILVADPYLKSGICREFLASIRRRELLRWIPIPPTSLDVSPPEDLRREDIARRYDGKSDRDSILRKAIALSAPTELVEELWSIEGHLSARLDPFPRVLYTANAFQSSPVIRHWAADSLQRGARLVTHQHGGGYGMDPYHLGEDHDIAVSHIFYSWGWQRSEFGHKVRPLPTAYPAHDKSERTGDYLLVSLPVTSHVYRLQAFLMPDHVARSVKETVSMINALCSGTRLRVRSSGDDGLPPEGFAHTKATVTYDDLKQTGAMAASRAKLVMHNYLGTSWLETLAMNVPTICFFNPEMYAPREAARPYVDALARVGVIHHSGADAAKFVNQLNGNPDAWWNSSEVQEARQAFVARYANFSDDWLQAWSDEFERLLAE